MQQDPEFWRKCFEDAVQRIERNANSLKILGQIIERCLLSSRIFFGISARMAYHTAGPIAI